MVVEGFVTNSENPIVVRLSRSQDFFNQNSFIPVEGASVQVSSELNADQLANEGTGYYVSSKV